MKNKNMETKDILKKREPLNLVLGEYLSKIPKLLDNIDVTKLLKDNTLNIITDLSITKSIDLSKPFLISNILDVGVGLYLDLDGMVAFIDKMLEEYEILEDFDKCITLGSVKRQLIDKSKGDYKVNTEAKPLDLSQLQEVVYKILGTKVEFRNHKSEFVKQDNIKEDIIMFLENVKNYSHDIAKLEVLGVNIEGINHSLEQAISNLLSIIFPNIKVRSIMEWWVFEREYLKDRPPLEAKDLEGNLIKLDTPEELADFLEIMNNNPNIEFNLEVLVENDGEEE